MAKFTNKDLRLKDGQKVTWGTDLDSNMWWDDAAVELRLDTVISGVHPTKPDHLTTRWYVDTEVTTASGGLQNQIDALSFDHGDLTGLGDDDHTQYVPTDGSRGFTSTVSGIDPIESSDLATKYYIDQELATLSGGIVQAHSSLTGLSADDHTQYHTDARGDARYYTQAQVDLHTDDDTIHFLESAIDHGTISGLEDDDHTQYSLADGTRAFTGVVGGITPTDDAHLTTKLYVDSLAQGLDWQDSVISFAPVASGVETLGNRYIADETGGGWTVNNIYEWDGTAWDETVVNEGAATWNEVEDKLYVFNGTDWVVFGSTVTHNNTSGKQGGTTDEYYHLTSDQYSSLTSTGGVEDASDMHTHDDRYYTETEVDTMVSGVEDQIITDHGALGGLGDDDHTQYTLADGTRAFTSTVGGVTPTADEHLTTKLYVDGEVSTLSGSLSTHVDDATIHFTEASIDHGAIAGLGDDDHTQYILVDGSRGFTNTVSGVTPVLDSDLATKAYVDSSDQPQLHGRQAIGDGASTVVVSFADVGSTNYTVNATMENTADSPPSVYAFIVSAKTSSSFTVTFMGDMDSANYLLDWMVVPD